MAKTGAYEMDVPLSYDKKKKKYDGGFSAVGSVIPEGGSRRVTEDNGTYKTDDSAGAGRGKGYAKGGIVRRGFGKARGC